MRTVSINSADAFLLVFSLDDPSSFEEAYKLKEMITDAKVNNKYIIGSLGKTSALGKTKNKGSICIKLTN